MKSVDSTIVIGILARDCANHLQVNIQKVEAMGVLFKDYHVVAYENDSTDGTTELLREWALRNPHVLSINEKTGQTTIPQKTAATPYPGQSYLRIEKMARFRNRVLKEVRERYQPDIFCFIDIDMEDFDPDTVVQAIDEAPKDWGALFANGQVIIDYKDHQCISPIMYDYFAYVKKGINPYQGGDYAIRIDDNLALTYMEQRLINIRSYHPCHSAFNGIGIYRWDLIKDLEYIAYQTPELKAVNASLCEHVPFNYEVVKQGYQLYIVRKMKTRFVHIPPHKVYHGLNKWRNYSPAIDFFIYNKPVRKLIIRNLLQVLRQS